MFLGFLTTILLGLGALVNINKNEPVVAKADTVNCGDVTFTIGETSSTFLKLYSAANDIPADSGWTYVYYNADNSPNSIILNGVVTPTSNPLPIKKIQSTYYYCSLSDAHYTPTTGDLFTLQGHWSGVVNGNTYTFNIVPLTLQFYGTEWIVYDTEHTHNCGNVELTTISSSNANSISFSVAANTVPYQSGDWEYAVFYNIDDGANSMILNGQVTVTPHKLPLKKITSSFWYFGMSDSGCASPVKNDIVTIKGNWAMELETETYLINIVEASFKWTGSDWVKYNGETITANVIDVPVSPEEFVRNAVVYGSTIAEVNDEYVSIQSNGIDPYLVFKPTNIVFLAAYCESIDFEYRCSTATSANFSTVFRFFNTEGATTKTLARTTGSNWASGTIPFTQGSGTLKSVRWDVINNNVNENTVFEVRNIVIKAVPLRNFVESNITSISAFANSNNAPQGEKGPSISLATTNRGNVGSFSDGVYNNFSINCHSVSEDKTVGVVSRLGSYDASKLVLTFPYAENLLQNGHEYIFTIGKKVLFDGNAFFDNDYRFKVTFNYSGGVASFTNLVVINEEQYTDATDEFTHHGLFTVSGGTIYSSNDAPNDVPDGFEGAFLKTSSSNNAKLDIDFANSNIPISLVKSIDYRFYTDENNPSDVKPEFRISPFNWSARSLPQWPIGQGDGGYRYIDHVKEWFEYSIDESAWRNSGYSFSILADETNPEILGGYETYFRTVSSCITYVDNIDLVLKQNNGVGPLITLNYGNVMAFNVNATLPTIATAYDIQEDRYIDVQYILTDGTPIENGKIATKGDYTLLIVATDYFGNTSIKEARLLITDPDDVDPVIDCPYSEITVPVGTNIHQLSFDKFVSDNNEYVVCEITYSANAYDNNYCLVAGTHTVTIEATDLYNNYASFVVTIHVVNNYSYSGQIIDENAIYQEVVTFVATYMHMDDYNENLGYCSDTEHHYYSSAKAAYNALSGEAKYLFLNDSEFAPAKERLLAWASANNETINSNGVIASRINNVVIRVVSPIILIITLSFVATLLVVRTIYVIKKRHK